MKGAFPIQGRSTFLMISKILDIQLVLRNIDQRHLRLILLLITLIFFVLGAAAPAAGGDFSG
jgi:hypothetical protein